MGPMSFAGGILARVSCRRWLKLLAGFGVRIGQAQGLAPTETVRGLRRRRGWRRMGRHKDCPYRYGEGITKAARVATHGQAQGLPLQIRGGDCEGGAGGGAWAGTRTAPTDSGRGLRRRRGWRRMSRHKACPYRYGEGIAKAARVATTGQAQGLAPTETVRGLRRRRGWRRRGRHKACPYRYGEGIAKAARVATHGQAQGLPLQKQ